MCESRMVCLPKPGKIRANNVVSVQDTRPITVLSCWWRIWSGTWTRSVVRAWMRAHIPQEFAVAHAVSCGEVIVELLDQLSTRGYLMTLDFTKAFIVLTPWLLVRSCSTWGGAVSLSMLSPRCGILSRDGFLTNLTRTR